MDTLGKFVHYVGPSRLRLETFRGRVHAASLVCGNWTVDGLVEPGSFQPSQNRCIIVLLEVIDVPGQHIQLVLCPPLESMLCVKAQHGAHLVFPADNSVLVKALIAVIIRAEVHNPV